MFFTFRLKGLLLAASLCAAAGYAEATTLCTPDAFGGYPSRVTLNTKAIQSAIDHCALQGGGEVRLRKGFWLSGPLTLKSHVTLNLLEGAILKADNREKDFVAAYIGSPTQDKEAFILASGADFWLDTGSFSSIGELTGACPAFSGIRCIREGNVFNCDRRINGRGGNDFWETGQTRPDLVLEDMIRIFHPEIADDPANRGLFGRDTLIYYRQMK